MRELIVDLDAVAANLNAIRSRISAPMVLGVVKANAYGHGMIEVARKLEAAGVDYLGVADIQEALELRAEGIDAPILAWLHEPKENFVAAIDAGIELGISSAAQLDRVAKASQQLRRVARIHLKIDTGLSRNGVTQADWLAVVKQAHGLVAEGFIQVVGIFSHLSNTSVADDKLQIARFEAAVSVAREQGLEFELRHLSASLGALEYPEAHYDMVRVGIALYGLSPHDTKTSADYGLTPVMTATAQVAHVKKVAADEGVSYGYLHRTAGETTLALVPTGYADGIPRSASTKAQVSIHDRRYSVSSRIAMDQFVLDVGDAPIEVGDLVTIFGDPAAGVPSADDWARAADTINYEIVTRIGGRFKRRYLGQVE
jgi:alanine racemase